MSNTYSSPRQSSADSRTHYATIDAVNTLESVLAEITRKETSIVDGVAVEKAIYDHTHTRHITIMPGCEACISNRHGGVRCNFHLKGGGTEMSKIYISQDVVRQTSGAGDAIISIQGYDTEKSIEASFENIEFMPVGAKPGEIFQSSNATNFEQEAVLAKIYFAHKVTFYKVRSLLENGKISQIDLRACSNILINECEFTNHNGLMSGNVVGSILMIRGAMQNVSICNNTFTKYGNDELLWIAFDSEPEPTTAGKIPAAEREVIIRSNLRIVDNNFIYAPPRNIVSAPVSRPHKIDVMITFESFKHTYWENVLVAGNNIRLNAVAHRVFWVQHAENAREFKEFRFIGNHIIHDYICTDSDAWTSDFWITGDSGKHCHEAIEIAHNQIIAAETMGNSSSGHICVLQTAMTLDVHDNLFDGSRFTLASSTAKGFIPFSAEYYSGIMLFHNNRCLNTFNLGQMLHFAEAEEFSLELDKNYVQGGSNLYFWNAPHTHLRLDDNYFRSNSYALMMHGSPKTGSLWASHNVWETTAQTSDAGYATDTGVIYHRDSGSGDVNLERVVFVDNIIVGERDFVAPTLPEAEITLNRGNDFTPIQSLPSDN